MLQNIPTHQLNFKTFFSETDSWPPLWNSIWVFDSLYTCIYVFMCTHKKLLSKIGFEGIKIKVFFWKKSLPQICYEKHRNMCLFSTTTLISWRIHYPIAFLCKYLKNSPYNIISRINVVMHKAFLISQLFIFMKMKWTK